MDRSEGARAGLSYHLPALGISSGVGSPPVTGIRYTPPPSRVSGLYVLAAIRNRASRSHDRVAAPASKSAIFLARPPLDEMIWIPGSRPGFANASLRPSGDQAGQRLLATSVAMRLAVDPCKALTHKS